MSFDRRSAYNNNTAGGIVSKTTEEDSTGRARFVDTQHIVNIVNTSAIKSYFLGCEFETL